MATGRTGAARGGPLRESRRLRPRGRRMEGSGPAREGRALVRARGNRAAAAEAFTASGPDEKAAVLYSELKDYDKAAALFRGAGRLPAAAAALQAGGRLDDAAQLFL